MCCRYCHIKMNVCFTNIKCSSILYAQMSYAGLSPFVAQLSTVVSVC